jgi:hypothetical protein
MAGMIPPINSLVKRQHQFFRQILFSKPDEIDLESRSSTAVKAVEIFNGGIVFEVSHTIQQNERITHLDL